MSQRAKGYYWVQYFGDWVVAYYSGEDWEIHGEEATFSPGYFSVVDERRIERAS